MNKNFFQKHSVLSTAQVQNLDKIQKRLEQPDFIEMLSIDGQEVAFLGPAIVDEDRLSGNYLRVDKMVIPEYAQMVVAEELYNLLSQPGYLNKKPIDMAIYGSKLLYKGKVEKSVLLNVCGMVYSQSQEARNFHACENVHPDLRGEATCPKTILSSDFVQNVSEAQHQLISLYISIEDIRISDLLEKEALGDSFERKYTVEEKLRLYFKLSETQIKGLKGVFLIPMLMADQGVTYFCLLNHEEDRPKIVNVKETLKYWCDQIHKYNKNQEELEIIIKGDDFFFFPIDQWSVFISQKAKPVVGLKI